MMPNPGRPRPEPGEKYRHFKKGDIYEVVVMSTSTQTGGLMVIYKNQEGQHFARPLCEFVGKVLWDGIRRWRFEKVENAESINQQTQIQSLIKAVDNCVKAVGIAISNGGGAWSRHVIPAVYAAGKLAKEVKLTTDGRMEGS